METIIFNKINTGINSNIDTAQHDFRGKHSAISKLIEILKDITNNFYNFGLELNIF